MDTVERPGHLSRFLSGAAPEPELLRRFIRMRAFMDDLLERVSSFLCEECAARVVLNNPFTSERLHGLLDPMEPNERTLMCVVAAIWSSPEWVLPLGFDEMRFSHIPVHDPLLSADASGVASEVIAEMGEEYSLCEGCANLLIGATLNGPQFRAADGTWHAMDYVLDRLIPQSPDGCGSDDFYLSGLVGKWSKALEQDIAAATVSLPQLWVPGRHPSETVGHEAARAILAEIAAGATSLREIHWSTLEDIVAELLQGLGLKVRVTPRTRDGGRDVIAEGEIIPGEPMRLAVEVKQMSVVGIGELRSSLWANRAFPALLVATSGRFSAGVIREKRRDDNCLRLYLKDGVGLAQWIDMYARRSATSATNSDPDASR